MLFHASSPPSRFCISLVAALLGMGQFADAAISFTGGTYSENFDSLGGSPWINNTTLPGWYAYISNPAGGIVYYDSPDRIWGAVSSYAGAVYQNLIFDRYGRNIGQSTGRSLLNLGTSDGALQRSLGSQNSGQDVVFGVALRNDTGTHIPAASVSFYGEQWQVNATSSNPSMKLDFTYGVFSSFNAALGNPNTLVSDAFTNGYTDPQGSAFDFAARQFGFTTAPLDGTAAGNRQLLSGTLPVNWGPGEYLVLRWFDDASNSANAMLAINDLQVTAIPEPSLGAILIIGTGFFILQRRRGEASE